MQSKKIHKMHSAIALTLTISLVVTGCLHNSQAQSNNGSLSATPAIAPTSLNGAYLPMVIQDPTLTPQPSPMPTLSPTAQPTTPVTITGDSVFGIEMENVLYGGQMLAGMGTTWVRRNALLWSAVEPIEGARNWSSIIALDQELAEASRLNMKVILIVRSTPGWAQKYTGSECGPVRNTQAGCIRSIHGRCGGSLQQAALQREIFRNLE